ncbi:hypothetical protein GH733_015024 [Mirounga leonina]|nr:hypothetical protein GH733_015024 [Mirounga leonina]
MINDLHTNIQEVFGRPFETEDAATLANLLLKQLKGLDPKGIIQSLGHTAGGMGLVVVWRDQEFTTSLPALSSLPTPTLWPSAK